MADTPRPSPLWLLGWAAAMILMLALLHFSQQAPEQAHEIPYSEFKRLVSQGSVAEIVLHGERIDGSLSEPAPIGPAGKPGSRFGTQVPVFGDPALLPALEQAGVRIRVAEADSTGVGSLVLAMLPWLVLIGVYAWFLRRMSGNVGGQAGLGKFLESSAKRAEVPKLSFADVAGQDAAKREVQELVDFLRAPERYARLGAEVPRGVLLMGPPGTGKTLLAKALAGEAGVPFFSISASEFIEVFVGVGASRVRHLFEAAKKSAPSIIFVDELDSIGRTRGTGLGGGHDEREQTLNQILAEMDGFAGHEAVIVLAATNRPDVLDPALLRPGRFDRHVTLDLPDRQDRAAILRVHTRKVPLAEDVDLDGLAAGTPGFSGADLKNLVNEAAMLAVHGQRDRVSAPDFDEARDKLLLGTARTLAIQPQERHRLAVHEAGHTLVAHFLPHTDPLYKVTIIPRGRALGGTQQLPAEERHTLPREYLLDRLAVALAGRAAEKLLLGSVSSGADDDIHQATALARAMVSRWGMSEEIGPVDLRESEDHPFLGREIAQPRRHSETSARVVDEAVRKLLLEAEGCAEAVITRCRPQLERLIASLEAHETLYREQIDACLGAAVDAPGPRAAEETPPLEARG